MSSPGAGGGPPDRTSRSTPDPPIAEWERDVGRRRGSRLAMQVVIDARTGVSPRETARRLSMDLRRMTRKQVELFEQELERAKRAPGPDLTA